MEVVHETKVGTAKFGDPILQPKQDDNASKKGVYINI